MLDELKKYKHTEIFPAYAKYKRQNREHLPFRQWLAGLNFAKCESCRKYLHILKINLFDDNYYCEGECYRKVKQTYLDDLNGYIRVKTIQPFMDHVLMGLKTFELRKNDRDYQVGKIMILEEWLGDHYGEEKAACEIVYMIDTGFGLINNHCVLGVTLLEWDKKYERFTE